MSTDIPQDLSPAPTPPMSDHDIDAVTVGENKPHNDQILLEPYDPQWPQQFEQLAAQIRQALGERALRIDHVGSTSVPGLSAKPIIDVLVTVADAADEEAYLEALTGAGFKLRIREPEWYDHRVLQNPHRRDQANKADGEIDCNIHVFSEGCPELDRMRIFRDWLRSNEQDRQAYEQVKRQLAAKQWRYVQNYADAKSGIVNQIMGRALAGR